MVTLGQRTRTTSEKRRSVRSATLLRMLQAASIAMTAVFPLPVAILQAYRTNSPGSSRGMASPWRRSALASVRKMTVSVASRWQKKNLRSRSGRFQYSRSSRVVAVAPGNPASRHAFTRRRISLTSSSGMRVPISSARAVPVERPGGR